MKTYFPWVLLNLYISLKNSQYFLENQGSNNEEEDEEVLPILELRGHIELGVEVWSPSVEIHASIVEEIRASSEDQSRSSFVSNKKV
jgi:hypothetical protein